MFKSMVGAEGVRLYELCQTHYLNVLEGDSICHQCYMNIVSNTLAALYIAAGVVLGEAGGERKRYNAIAMGPDSVLP